MLDQGSAEDTQVTGQACINTVNGGTDDFILTGGCDLPPTVKLKNLKVMLDLDR